MVTEKLLFARQVFIFVAFRKNRPLWLPVTKLVGEIGEMKGQFGINCWLPFSLRKYLISR